MKRGMVEQIADAILYEGYILYPYRPSSLKNRHRWNFGGLCPRSYSEIQQGTERWRSRTECLVTCNDETVASVKIRFLHLVDRQVARVNTPAMELTDCSESDFEYVESLELSGRLFQNWQEANEREIEVPHFMIRENSPDTKSFRFHLPASRAIEPLRDPHGRIAAVLIRTQNALELEAQISVEQLQASLCRLRLETLNLTPFTDAHRSSRSDAMMFSLVSSHAILQVQNGEFVSLLDPPPPFAEAAARCESIGAYPVLVGSDNDRSTILSSPVILYDYPKIAPESAGDLYDSTEIDEILTLRVLALTDAEKSEMRQCDDHARRILERVESNPEHLANLHGTIRSIGESEKSSHNNSKTGSDEWTEPVKDWNPFELEDAPKLESVRVSGIELRCGDRVRLCPYKKADIMDLALIGKVAVIESIEQDYDEKIHLAVILDEDPGRDLGELRQPGHRFFFTPDEVDPVTAGASPRKPARQDNS